MTIKLQGITSRYITMEIVHHNEGTFKLYCKSLSWLIQRKWASKKKIETPINVAKKSSLKPKEDNNNQQGD